MKEIVAIIRKNKINATKRALSEGGFPAITCKVVYGRGKKKVNYELIEELIGGEVVHSNEVMEAVSEGHRLIAKRMLMMVVHDDEVEKAVKIIMDENQSGNMGDGKIFVVPVVETYRVRTGETGEEAV